MSTHPLNPHRRALALRKIIDAEWDLLRTLSAGERRDLIKDNFPWESTECDAIANDISCQGTWRERSRAGQ